MRHAATRSRARLAAITLLVAAGGARAAAACTVCFGDPTAPQNAGMNGAILLMLGLVALLWTGMIAFVLRMRWRVRRAERQRARFHLIEGGAR